MKRKDFIEKLSDLKLTQKEFAELSGCSYQTVKQWKDNKIPKWVDLLLTHMRILKENVSLAKTYGIKY